MDQMEELLAKARAHVNECPLSALGGALVLGLLLAWLLLGRRARAAESKLKVKLVNLEVDKTNQKVVHTCSISDVEDAGKIVYCRCWRSKKFPLCDGSHVQHNKLTGDNVGPLIVGK